MSTRPALRDALGHEETLVGLAGCFDAVVGPTPMPWHREGHRDFERLLHRTGPDFHRPGAFIAWARRRQDGPDPVFRIDAVFSLERLRLNAPAWLTLVFYDRGQLDLRVYISAYAYLAARRVRP